MKLKGLLVGLLILVIMGLGVGCAPPQMGIDTPGGYATLPAPAESTPTAQPSVGGPSRAKGGMITPSTHYGQYYEFSGTAPSVTTNRIYISGGQLYFAGSAIASLTGSETLTNKRITKRTSTILTGASLTPASDSFDLVLYHNGEGAGTATINAPTGTPTAGQCLEIIIKANAAQTFAWNGAYVDTADVSKPATIGAGKEIAFVFQYNTIDSVWYLVAMTNLI